MSASRGQDHLALELEPKLEACAYTREALRVAFGKRLPERVLIDLITVVGELVTNAIQHGPGRPISVKVSLDADADVIRGEVVDDGDATSSIPRIREATGGGGGYGLRLVDVMTSEWAVVEGSTSVRFEMPASAG